MSLDKRLGEIRERLGKVTKEPWFFSPEKRGKRMDGSEYCLEEQISFGTEGDDSDTYSLFDAAEYEANMRFCAESKDNIEYCLRVIELFREALVQIRREVTPSSLIYEIAGRAQSAVEEILK
jgi:hypothetical protein